jgi:hypothetical protein
MFYDADVPLPADATSSFIVIEDIGLLESSQEPPLPLLLPLRAVDYDEMLTCYQLHCRIWRVQFDPEVYTCAWSDASWHV